MARRNSDSGRQAIIWLATTYIVLIGAAASAFVLFAAAEQHQGPWIVWGGCFAGIMFVLIVFNIRWEEPLNQLKFWLSFQNRRDPADEYQAARRSIHAREKYGTNVPPSVDSVRDAADHGGAWVPRSSASKRQRKPS